jgi:hypothetical protein
MATGNHTSFSRGRRWGIGFHVVLIVLIVLAVVVMVNYLSRAYFYRYYISAHSRMTLSPQTINFVRSITNKVKVTIYYDQKEPLYTTVAALLGEYEILNPRIRVETVDYLRDPGAAQRIKAAYQLGSSSDRDLILFECEGRRNFLDGKALAKYEIERTTNQAEPYRRKPTFFEGERAVTAFLIKVSSPRVLKALMLKGHGEHSLDSDNELTSYKKFSEVLRQNSIEVGSLSLLGTNPIPPDCNLLIVAGPRARIENSELDKIDLYLTQGGRMMVLLSADSIGIETGMERVLAKWTVQVGGVVVKDPANSSGGEDVVATAYTAHPMVNAMKGFGLELIRPRPVWHSSDKKTDAPKVEEVAWSSPDAYLAGDASQTRRQMPLVAVLEKGEIKGLVTERGTTKMVIVGDSLFLANHEFDHYANRTFANSAVNWLLERPELLQGIGPRAIREYRLQLTAGQLQTAQWILLAFMPGAILLVGSLVWLRRRR